MGKKGRLSEGDCKGQSAKEDGRGPIDTRSLAKVIQDLQRNAADQTAKVILPKIHKIIKRSKKKNLIDYRKIRQKLRICKICDKWNNISSIIQCSICQDNYHKFCLNAQSSATFVCPDCKLIAKAQILCGKCKKEVDQQKSCSDCNMVYHEQCWKGKGGKCLKCSKLQKQVKKAQSFKPQDHYKKYIAEDTVCTTFSTLFRYQKLIKDERELKKYSESLLQAIKQKGMVYTEELINMKEFDDIMNECSMDFGINHMIKAQKEAYEEYKKLPIGPFLFKQIEGKGYDVVADKTIPAKSLICEYVGEVVTLRECILLENITRNDSLMELQSGKNSEETLIIRPQKFTNMARFINGVRKNKEGNVQTMKLLYKGRPIVLLVTKREVKKGESLCYDYNAGGIAAEYDTSHFL